MEPIESSNGPSRPSVEATDDIIREAEGGKRRNANVNANDEQALRVDPNFSVCEAIGMPLLTKDPTPLSTALHLPVLVNESKPATGGRGAWE